MLNYIEKLQKKPEHVRRSALHAIVLVIMGIIVLVWISTLTIRFSNTETEPTSTQSTASPISVLKSMSSSFWTDFNRGLERLKETL